MESFFNWWQHIPQNLSPNLITIGSIPIRWYSLMYIIAFIIVYLLANYRLKKENYNFLMDDKDAKKHNLNPKEYKKNLVDDFYFYGILGVILGGRLGYVIFYQFEYYIQNPLEIIIPFSFTNGCQYTGIGGMSYHGAVIGLVLVFIIFCRKRRIYFWKFTDLFIPAIPIAYTFGRIGNFINGELYGRITDSKWGMYFPLADDQMLRHPSQLYEAFFEGIFLFVILWLLRNKFKKAGIISGLYLLGYGLVRFFIEFVRQPDPQFKDIGDALGTVFLSLTMGQILCFLMIVAGVFIIYNRKKYGYTNS